MPVFVDKDSAQARFDTCKQCEHFFKPTNSCKVCGCFMKAKVKLFAAECPVGEW